jgi:hypothetical protein
LAAYPECYFCRTIDSPMVLAAHQGQTDQGTRKYVAWMCESCTYTHGHTKFAREVSQEHGPVWFVSEPEQPWESHTHIPH